ncbi:MAG: hypothetical protein NUW02_02990 [Candidatus Campbellbacteria bacterium]|nr:hypothetical protein [Candidatus Campbellbacteria bacterium]
MEKIKRIDTLDGMKPLVRLPFIFLLAFILNFVWEELHSVLYVHYQGEAITHLILLRAGLFDAFFITLVSLPSLFIPKLRGNLILPTILATIFAIGLELFALNTGRWVYTDAMPLIPYIQTGFTPSIQLGLLTLITLFVVLQKEKEPIA